MSLLRWFRRDRPDRPYLVQMRELWGVPPEWTHRQTARVLPRLRTKWQATADRILRKGRAA